MTCFSDARSGGASDAEGDNLKTCDSRLKDSASISEPRFREGNPVGVTGTCVPVKGAKLEVFNNQNSSDTFRVPQGTSRVSYKIYGGSGGKGGSGGNGGKGGYIEGSIPVDGGTNLNVYVGQNGETGLHPDNPRGGTEGRGGRGGCVPFDGITCAGDGGDGGIEGRFNVQNLALGGGGGGGSPTMITSAGNNILVAAGGGGGTHGDYDSGGGGGAGGGDGGSGDNDPVEQATKPGEDADNTPKNLGGDAGSDGSTFAHSEANVVSTGSSHGTPRAELAAIP